MNYNQADFIKYLNNTHWSLKEITDISSSEGDFYILFTVSDDGTFDHLMVTNKQLENYYEKYMTTKRDELIDDILDSGL